MDDPDERLIRDFAGRAAEIPGVLAVALGGSRAEGTHGPDSDFDFAIYYRGRLDTADVRAVGWEGDVFEPGDWGGGVMNGGAFLRIDGRKVDLHYRDLDEVERWIAEAEAGRFRVERLPLYLAGIPTYVVVAELALARVLAGELPRPSYPEALRQSAPPFWRGAAALSINAAGGYADRGLAVETAGNLARALLEVAHARAAERGQWVLNEKRLIDAVGLTALREPFARFGPSSRALRELVSEIAHALD